MGCGGAGCHAAPGHLGHADPFTMAGLQYLEDGTSGGQSFGDPTTLASALIGVARMGRRTGAYISVLATCQEACFEIMLGSSSRVP